MGWQTGQFDTAPTPMTWTGENTVPGAAALEQQAMDDVLDNLDAELPTDSSPSFRRVETAWWDLSDSDVTPPPELWHGSVGEGSGTRDLSTLETSRADTEPNFDDRRTTVWSPSPELQARASELIGQPMAVPTPPGLSVEPEGTRPPSAPYIEPGKLVFPAETPRAILPTPQRSAEHAFTPVKLQPGQMLRPANLAKGSIVPMSARSLQIVQPGRPVPQTAMLRLEPARPGLFARLAGWVRGLFRR